MSKIKMSDALFYEQPTNYIVNSINYDNSYSTPVLTAGQSFILGYTNEKDNVFTDLPVIIFDDFTTAVQYVDFPFKVKSSAMKILKATGKANAKYMYYLLTTISVDTGLHKRYWISIFADMQIELPDLKTQVSIVHELDKVCALIDCRNKQLKKLDDLVKSRFIEMFGGIRNSRIYPYIPIKSIATVISGGTPSRDISDYWNGDIRWVKTTELQNCIITDTEEKITQAGLDNSSAKICHPNTILIAMYGQGKTRGMTALLQTECSTNQACACILPSDSYNSNYLWHYLMLCYDDLRSKAKGGSQPNLNGEIIKNYTILLPPIFIQDDFSIFVAQVDKSKFACANVFKNIARGDYHDQL